MNHFKNSFSALGKHKTKLQNLKTRLFDSKTLVISQSTPYEIIDRYQGSKIRFYSAVKKKYREPLVFVAPLAINMAIYDLYPYRSLIQFFRQQGFDVYLVDWGKFTRKDRHLNFHYFVKEALPYCVQHILQHAEVNQISLHGWSMAGIFTLLYTTQDIEKHVKNLIILGSPIDAYRSGRIGKFYQSLAFTLKKTQLSSFVIHKIPTSALHSTGFMNRVGFKVLDPIGLIQGHRQLLQNLDDEKVLAEHATLGDFLNNMIDYPGGVNRDMLLNVWLQNPLKHGKIQLANDLYELNQINCSLLVGAGRNDQMVTAAAVQPLVQLTNSADVTFTDIPGGHLGLMSSQASANEFWPMMAQWLASRSTTIKA